MKKCWLLILLFLFNYLCYSKENNSVDTVYINSPIVNNGFLIIKHLRFDAGDHEPRIIINSTQKEVYSLTNGKMRNIIKVSSNMYVLAIEHKGLIYMYQGIEKPLIKENAIIKKGEKIGELVKDGNLYTLFFFAFNKKLREISQEKIEKLLYSSN